MHSDEYVLYFAVERGRIPMHKIHMALRGSVFGIFALCAWAYHDFRQDMWPIVTTYLLTGLAIFLAGIIADLREPKKMEVLLRHDGQGWLLDVMVAHDGTISAPRHEDARRLRKVALGTVSENILGAPRFNSFQGYDGQGGFILLGERYYA